MKKKAIILFDVLIIILAIVGISINTTMPSVVSSIRQTKSLEKSEDLGFNFIPSPNETKVKAGETVTIKLNVADFNIGEDGLNSIVGFLKYDETLFESMKIEASENWKVELNQRKKHPLYGKFCIYTMQQGVNEEQKVATITLKLKSDLKPQTTEVKFEGLVSSDGNVGVAEEDRKVKIIIYEDEILDEPDEPVISEKPDSPKTGDKVIGIALGVIGLVAILNIIVLMKSKKNKLIASVITTIVFSILIATAVFATTTENLQTFTNLSSQESWLNSTKYLINDGRIARIEPKTSLAELKENINKTNITVYDNQQAKENNQISTKYFISTNMKIKIDDEENDYLVSVLGDLDCDGDANQVELTSIIRYIANSEKWKIVGNKKISADLTCDSKINVNDVESLVKYIVYEELEVPEVPEVAAPTIEVVDGNFDETQNCYIGEVTVKITQNEQNAVKTMYKIEGELEQGYTKLDSTNIVKISENGIYKISAYTYGKLENRSSISSKIISIGYELPKEANYKTEYYTEGLDGTYELESSSVKQGIVGKNVTAEDKSFIGFTLDTSISGTKQSGEVLSEGQLTLKLYYTRNRYTLSLIAGENIESVNGAKTYKYNEPVEIGAILNRTDGYNVEFEKWESNNKDIIKDLFLINENFVMPAGNITLTASASKTINKYGYTVEYYYDGLKDETKTQTSKSDFGSKITSAPSSIITGYKSDKIEGLPLTISSNKLNNVIRIYYIKDDFDYTVNYYYDGIKDESKTEISKQKYNTSIINYTDKIVNGYELDRVQGLPITISEVADNNVVNVYYKAKEYNLTYVLNGGYLQETNQNPIAYRVTTPDFKINNPVKQGYTFTGWTLTKLNGEVTILGTPQTSLTIAKGTVGNREYTANWIADADTQYKVEHYKEKLDGTYELAVTDTLGGTTDSTVSAKAKTYEGFTFDGTITGTKQSGIITADGQLVLKIYYKRNIYTLTLVAGENIASVNGEGEYKYGQSITISTVLKDIDGYSVTFEKWTSNMPEKFANILQNSKEIIMPGANITLTASGIKTKNNYDYSVEYYYDGIINATQTDTSNAEFASIISTYSDKNITGYKLDKVEGLPLTITSISSNNIIKVYYIKDNFAYDINYYYDGVKDTERTFSNLGKYNSVIIASDVQTLIETNKIDGYEFQKITGTPLTINENRNDNQINIYYISSSFDLSYVLNGGIVDTPNNTSYKVTTSTFTLNNPHKDGYTFIGWTLTKLNNETQTVETPQLNQKIVKGFTGNREYTANWIADTDTQYKVKHYKENLDGTYSLETTQTLGGETDSDVSATPKTYNGFTFDNTISGTKQSGKITADGLLELNLYYRRNTYTLTLVAGENIASVNGAGTYKYGQSIDISAILENITGYSVVFAGWTSDVPGILPNIVENNKSIIMPLGNVTLTASATKTINKYNYTVKYYYDDVIDIDKTSISQADFQSTITTYDNKEIEGYKLDKVEGLPLTVSTIEDNNIINVYYKTIIYQIEYNLDGGTVATQNPIEYRVITPNITLINPSKPGYTFTGWTGSNGEIPNTSVSIIKGSTGNREYMANWSANTGIQYKVEHYKQKLDESYELAETENKDGVMDSTVSAIAKTYDGFTLDTTVDGTKESGKVTVDGDLVLKLYYTRNTYTLTLVAGDNIESVNGAGTYKYEQSINISAIVENITGYSVAFTGWTSNSPEILSNITENEKSITMPFGNITLTANAIKTINKYNYRVEYYYDDIKEENKDYEIEYGSVISSYTDVPKTGYIFDKTEGLPLTVTSESQNNVIKVYYKKDNFGYKINYYYDEVKDDSRTEELTAVFDSTITLSDLTAKIETNTSAGFELDTTNGTPLKISENDDNNIINIYYKSKTYNINYALDGGSLADGVVNPTTYKVTTQDIQINNPIKSGYTFIGWTLTKLNDEIQTAGTPQTTQKIIKGSTGNREYTANWIADTDTQYKVEHYKEDLEGNYELDSTDTLGGTTDITVTATPNTYAGFTFDSTITGTKQSGTITADGKLVLKLYYTRNTYSLTLVAGENIASVSGANTYKYEQLINISAEIQETDGYTTTFNMWESGTPGLMANITEKSKQITMPLGDITLTAKATKIKTDFDYTIKYYYDGVLDLNKTETGTAQFGSAINYNSIQAPNKVIEGYEEDHIIQSSLVISSNTENNVMEIYYIATTYNIDYVLDEGVLSDGETNPSTYKITTPTIILKNPIKEGYTFIGWTLTKLNNEATTGETSHENVTINNGSMGNREYTANWSANKDTAYTVNHYLEQLDGKYKLEQTENLNGETNSQVEATSKVFEGFTYDTTVKERILTGDPVMAAPALKTQGTISPDGTLVLSLYYTRNLYTLLLVAGENIASVSGAGEFKYGQEVQIEAQLSEIEGYTVNWSEWITSDTTKLENQNIKNTTITIPSSNITLTANATKSKNNYQYTIEYYYDDEINTEKTQTLTAQFEEEIKQESIQSKINNNIIVGYELNKTEGLPLTITTNETTNVIKIYYTASIYNISYVMDEDVVEAPNPTTYKITTPSITLNNPTKSGYTFTGWTLTKLNGEVQEPGTPQMSQIIANGSTRDREYTANWIANQYEYSVEYYYDDVKKMNLSPVLYEHSMPAEGAEGVIGSPSFSYYRPCMAFDNNINSSWIVNNSSAWVKWKMNSPIRISEIDYQLTSRTPKNMMLEGSNDGEIWINLGNTEWTQATDDEVRTVAYDYDTEYLYYKWSTADSWTPGQIEIREIQIKTLGEGENKSAEYGSVISSYTKAPKTGYEFDRVEGLPLTVTSSPEDNVVKVYYKKINYGYTINYYYDGVKDESKTENLTALFDSTVLLSDLTTKIETNTSVGYELDTTEGIPLTISEIEDNNIINIYYKSKIYNIDYELNGGSLVEGITNPVTYKITTSDIQLNNPIKEGYTFTGWTLTKLNGEVQEPGTPQMSQIIANGSTGDREYTANWIANSDTQYKVEHYKEKLDGTYELDSTETLRGTTDTIVTAEAKTYQGFTFDNTVEGTIESGVITANGELTLKLYYTRNLYTLTLNVGTNVQSISDGEDTTTTTITKQYDYGTQIHISAILQNDDGYEYEFTCWKSADENIISDQAAQDAIVGMPNANVTLTAQATKRKKDYGYTIKYYYDGVQDTSKTETGTAQFASTINYNSVKAPNKIITGYEEQQVVPTSLVISSNLTNNVMEIYYIATTYNINYILDGGVLAEVKTNPSTYKITDNDFTLNNPTKEGYTFTGWTLTKLNNEATTGETSHENVTINNGSMGNREYTANWLADTDTAYTVNHYLEQLDGKYKLEQTENLNGETNSQVEATSKVFEGFTYDNTVKERILTGDPVMVAPELKTQGTILPDGTLVLSLYYTRNLYTLTLVAGENIASVSGAGEFKYGQEIQIDAQLSDIEGYLVNWSKWTSSDTTKIANQNEKNATITIPASDVVLTANATKSKKNYQYTIEYYYDDEKNVAKTQTLTSQFENEITQATIQSRINNNMTVGYELNKTEGLPLTITTNVETNIIKIYYIASTYNISYVMDEDVVEAPNPTTYKVTTPSITLNNPTKLGYTFNGWELTKLNDAETTGETPHETTVIALGSTGNREYTARWIADTDTSYNVKHYKEKLDGTYDIPEEESLVGETGTTVTATAKTYEGFTLDTSVDGTVQIGEIAPDGSLVLSLYYTRNRYNLTLVAGENIASVNGAGNYKYGEQVTIGAEFASTVGYVTVWSNWTSSDTSKISNLSSRSPKVTIPAADVTLTANATLRKDKFNYSINYYYDNVKDSSKTVTLKDDYENIIITYEDKKIDGYELDRVEGIPLEITANEEENVMNVYYKLINYTITYNLDGGELPEGIENPETFNIKTPAFTLNNPIKTEFTFTGWTGSNGETPQQAVEVDTSVIGNKEFNANWTTTTYTLTIHHYEEGTGIEGIPAVQVAEDETIVTPTGVTYQTSTLLSESNVLKQAEQVIETSRNYIDPNKYVYINVTRDEENSTVDEFGTVNGTVVSKNQDITYYYHVNTNTLTTEVIGGNGEISNSLQNVRYGESSNEIVCTPNDGYKIDTIRIYVGDEIGGTYDDESGKDIKSLCSIENLVYTIPAISDFTENKHIVVRYKERAPVAQITAVPSGMDGWQSTLNSDAVLGHTYYTLEDAIADAYSVNSNKSEESTGVVRIKLLDDVDNESNVIQNDNNIELDLNGYTITSYSSVPALRVEEATLIVQDTSVLETGKVISTKGVGIWITPEGSLTLGNNNNQTSQTAPTVQGVTYGIFKEKDSETNEEGIFNFFDGQILGQSAAVGGSSLIDETPSIYDPYDQTVIVDDVNSQRKTLQVISGVEAIIGKSRYPTVEEAFHDVITLPGYTEDTPVEIELVNDAIVEDVIDVTSVNPLIKKNIILDLNGHSIVSNTANSVISNSEKLQIIDSGLPEEELEDPKVLVQNGTSNAETGDLYGFKMVGDHLESDNAGVASSTASSYIEIDLTDKPDTQTFNVDVDAASSCQANYDWMYATISSTTTRPTESATSGRFIHKAGLSSIEKYSTTIQGGSIYYLHLGYYKNNNADGFLDCAKIYGITLDGVSLLDGLRMKTGKIVNTNSNTIVNTINGELTISGGTINMSRSADYLAAVLNENILNIDGGFLETGSSNTVYGVNNKSTGILNVVGGVFNCLNTNNTCINNTSGGIVNISDNAILNARVNSIINKGEATIDGGYFVSNTDGIGFESTATGIVNNAFIRASGSAIVSKATGIMTVNNANIYGGSSGLRMVGSGTMIVNNANINNASYGISQISGTVTVNDIIIAGCLSGVNTQKGIVNINKGSIRVNNTGFYIDYASTINIYDDVYLESGSRGVYNTNIFNMYGGTIKSSGNTIYNYSNGRAATSNIYSGVIECLSTASNTYIIENNDNSEKYQGIVNIGKKNDETETQISTTSPTLRGNKCSAMYCLNEGINFYDGQIICKEKIITAINEMEKIDSEGNKVDIKVTNIEDNTLKRITLEPRTESVARISKDSIGIDLGSLVINKDYTEDEQYYYFIVLDDAIKCCSLSAGENQTIIELISNYETARKLEVLDGQNIILDLNGHEIVSNVFGPYITNNGTFKLKDSSEKLEENIVGTGIITLKDELVINNSNMIIESGTYNNTLGGTTNYKKNIVNNIGNLQVIGGIIKATLGNVRIINNQGILTTSNCTISENDNTAYGIYNQDLGEVIINDGTIIKNVASELTGGYAVYNVGTKRYEEGISNPGIIINGGQFMSGAVSTIVQNGTGEIVISGENVNIESRSKSGIEVGSEGLITVNEGLINSVTNNGVTVNDGGTFVMNGGTVTGAAYGINSSGNYCRTVIVNGGTITGKQKGICDTGNYAQIDGRIIIIKITGQNPTHISGIKNGIEYGTASVEIGIEGGVPSVTNPLIEATGSDASAALDGIGVNNKNGTLKFFDGKIIGLPNKSISGTILKQETGYDIVKNINAQDKEESTLQLLPVVKVEKENVNTESVEEINTISDENYYYFYSIEDAATCCKDNEETVITVMRDITYIASHETENIPANKNVKIDLYGNSISASDIKSIHNDGTLEFIDTFPATTATIQQNGGTILENAGIFNMNQSIHCKITFVSAINLFKNTGEMNISDCMMSNIGTLGTILNEGELNITNGTFNSNKNGVCSIENDGRLNILNGTFDDKIVNKENGIIKIENGTFNCSIENSGISIYEEGVSEPAVLITGGTFENNGFNLNNKGIGQIIVKKKEGDDIKFTNKSGSSYDDNRSIINTSTGEIILEGVNVNTVNAACVYNINSNGSIVIKSGYFKAKTGICIYNSGLYTMYDGDIQGGINNNGTCTINNGTITASSTNYAIQSGGYSSSASVLNIYGGTVQSLDNNKSAIFYGKSTEITIGTNDGVLNNSSPVIMANGYSAITSDNYGYGTIHYYDGIISGKGRAVDGNISSFDNSYQMIVTVVDEIEELRIGDTIGVAYIGDDSTITYNTLKEAIAACTGTINTINLIKDIAVTTGDEIEIPNTKNITLNLNNHLIIGYTVNTIITNNGIFTLTDSNIDSVGLIRQYSETGIRNNGTLTISGGKIESKRNKAHKIIDNASTSDLNMTGGVLSLQYISSSANNTNDYAIYSNTSANINMTGGIIYINNTHSSSSTAEYLYGICVENQDSEHIAKITISDDAKIEQIHFASVCIGISIKSNGNIDILGGTIIGCSSGSLTGIQLDSGILNMTGGSFNSKSGYGIKSAIGTIINYSGTAYITSETSYGIDCKGTLNMTGGTINGATGISVSGNNSNAVISGGIISGNSNGMIVGTGAEVLITEATISQTGSSYSSNGINIIGTGKVTLGVNDNKLTNNLIQINSIGTAVSVNSSAKFYYYDGRLHGEAIAINGKITEKSYVFDVIVEDEGKTNYIGVIPVTEAVVKVGSSYANSFADAITTIVNTGGTGTIELQRNLVTDVPIVIPESVEGTPVNITIDLNGNNMRWAGTEQPGITNNATLTIINSSEDGIDTTQGATLLNDGGVVIMNKGILKIGDDSDGIVYVNSPRLLGATYAVDNTTSGAVVYLYDGILKGIVGSINGIVNYITSISGYSQLDSTEDISGTTYFTKTLEN